MPVASHILYTFCIHNCSVINTKIKLFNYFNIHYDYILYVTMKMLIIACMTRK